MVHMRSAVVGSGATVAVAVGMFFAVSAGNAAEPVPAPVVEEPALVGHYSTVESVDFVEYVPEPVAVVAEPVVEPAPVEVAPVAPKPAVVAPAPAAPEPGPVPNNTIETPQPGDIKNADKITGPTVLPDGSTAIPQPTLDDVGPKP